MLKYSDAWESLQAPRIKARSSQFPRHHSICATVIVFPLKSARSHAITSWREQIYKLPPASCLSDGRVLRETSATHTFKSALPPTIHAAISVGKDGDSRCARFCSRLLFPKVSRFAPVQVRAQELALDQWDLVLFNGISQFHPVLVATKAFSPVSMTCYILTCVVISAVDLCGALFFAHGFIA